MRSLSGRWSPGPPCVSLRRLPIACLSGALLLAACVGPGDPPPGLLDNLLGQSGSLRKTAHKSEPDAAACGSPAQCQGVLKTMIDSPDRGWIGKRQAPDSYASGTRLFAYRALRKRLTCNELALAVDELSATSKSLNGQVQGMAPDEQSRTLALSTAVTDELTSERADRCRS